MAVDNAVLLNEPQDLQGLSKGIKSAKVSLVNALWKLFCDVSNK